MPQYLSPGVYVEEVEAGSRPIEGVGTAVAAFVGLAARGPFNQPTLVTNWSQFVQLFGDFIEGSYLAHSVYGYFLNGGGACYVVRIGATARRRQPAASCRCGPTRRCPYRVTALERGSRGGNDITVEVARGQPSRADDIFKLVVSAAARSRRSSTTSPPSGASRTSSPWSRTHPS